MSVTELGSPIATRRIVPAQAGRWPASTSRRWMLRGTLGTPFLVIALIADQRGIVSAPNRALGRAGAAIDWGSPDLSFVRETYPPIPTAIAAVVPDSAIWNGVVGALCAGIVLQLLCERLQLRHVRPWLAVLLLASTALIPAFVYAATQDLVAFLGLALFAIALSGLVRFAVDGDTEGGFQCGLALGVAAMCDPATVVVAVALGAAAPLIGWRRYRDQPHAFDATLVIVTFPTVAALAGWAFLEWRFTGAAFHSIRADPDFLAFPGGVIATLQREAVNLGLRLAVMPVFVVAAIMMAMRRPLALGAHALVLGTILATQSLGLNYGSGQGILFLAAVAIMSIEHDPGRTRRAVLGAACIAQAALLWYPLRPNTAVYRFTDQLLHGL